MFSIYLLVFLCTPYSHAMRSYPMQSNHDRATIVLKNATQTLPFEKLQSCKVIAEQLELKADCSDDSKMLDFPRLSKEEWQDFAACLGGNDEVIQKKLNDKKRLRSILTISHYVDHPELFKSAVHEWVTLDLNPDNTLGDYVNCAIAQKTLEETPLAKKLSKWAAKTTTLIHGSQNVVNQSWSCCTTQSSTSVAVGSCQGEVRILKKDGAILKCWKAHENPISDMHYSHDDIYLFTVAYDGTVKQWSAVDDYAHVHTYEIETDNHPFNLHVHPETNHFVIDLPNVVEVRNYITGELQVQLPSLNNSCNGLRYSKNGALLAACNPQGVHLYNTVTHELIRTLPGRTQKSCSVEFNNDATRLFIGCDRGSLHIFDLNTFTLIKSFNKAHQSAIWGIVVSACNRFLFTGGADSKVKIWDLRTNNCIKSIPLPFSVNDMRLTKDMELLIACSDRKIRHLPLKPFFEKYYELGRFFSRDITLEEAQLLRKAFEINKDEEPLNIAHEPAKSVFYTLPIDIQHIVLNELPIQHIIRKKGKTAEELDEDYTP